ncbi:MAG: hypothetical protein II184_01490, partial [Clostridia bacterium]|nr:hypothetical protein [Clostridia bacterium]
GGYFDNYYMQLIANVRRYKGCDEVPVQEALSAADGTLSMRDVAQSGTPYFNFPKGCYVRDFAGYNTHYRDHSGRNAIVCARTAHDADNLYFYARTLAPLEKYDYDSAWMQLYLNVENLSRHEYSKRWKGYNYLAGAYQFTDRRTTLSRCIDDSRTLEADTFRPSAVLDFEFADNEIMYRIPKAAVGLGPDDRFEIGFKWFDSRVRPGRMEDFYTSGDAAPIGRLNWVFRN